MKFGCLVHGDVLNGPPVQGSVIIILMSFHPVEFDRCGQIFDDASAFPEQISMAVSGLNGVGGIQFFDGPFTIKANGDCPLCDFMDLTDKLQGGQNAHHSAHLSIRLFAS